MAIVALAAGLLALLQTRSRRVARSPSGHRIPCRFRGLRCRDRQATDRATCRFTYRLSFMNRAFTNRSSWHANCGTITLFPSTRNKFATSQSPSPEKKRRAVLIWPCYLRVLASLDKATRPVRSMLRFGNNSMTPGACQFCAESRNIFPLPQLSIAWE